MFLKILPRPKPRLRAVRMYDNATSDAQCERGLKPEGFVFSKAFPRLLPQMHSLK